MLFANLHFSAQAKFVHPQEQHPVFSNPQIPASICMVLATGLKHSMLASEGWQGSVHKDSQAGDSAPI